MSEIISKFNSSISSGISPLTVNFTNLSTGPFTSCIWNFGDGNTSTEIHPVHQFLSNGVFQVTLTINAQDGSSTSSNQTISVYAQGVDTPTGLTVQHGLFTTKRFDPGQINVVKQTQYGSTFNTSYPFSSSTDFYSGNVFELSFINLYMSGNSVSDLYYSSSTLDANDLEVYITGNGITNFDDAYLSLIVSKPNERTTSRWGDVFDYSSDPKQVITYKVLSANTLTKRISLDRNVPYRISGVTLDTGYTTGVLFHSTSAGTNNVFFDGTNIRSLKSKQSIDSLQKLEVSGISYIDQTARGSLNYLGYNEGTGQTINVIYPNYNDDLSADAFYPGTIQLCFPHIMWHNSQTPGIKLYDTYGSIYRDEENGLRYKHLRDGQSSSDNIVGKVFYDKKIVVIDDVELNAALQFSSNRSYTLPKSSVSLTNIGSGFASSGVVYYVTYRVYDKLVPSVSGSYGLGWLKPIHCRYIQRVEIDSSESSDFRIQIPSLYWRTSDYSAGTGFTTDNIEVLIGTGTTGSTYADPSSWKYSATTYSNLTNGIVITGLSSTSYVLDNSATGTTNLSLGTENISLGYLSGNFETNIYKLAITSVAKNNEFNNTQNPTYSGGSIYFTELAIYNEANDLLLTAKFNKPIEKNETKYVVVKSELDL